MLCVKLGVGYNFIMILMHCVELVIMIYMLCVKLAIMMFMLCVKLGVGYNNEFLLIKQWYAFWCCELFFIYNILN